MKLSLSEERKEQIDWINRVCEDRRWTLTEFARIADIHPSTLTRFMAATTGNHILAIRTLRKLQQAASEPHKPHLTHLNDEGEARMVDVGDKAPTRRRAVASARIAARPETVDAIFAGTLGKGDALAVARVAGIMAAKKTSDLIPLCHPIALSKAEVEIARAETSGSIEITATAETTDRTGVEMEALTAASVAALTLYDMAKAIDRAMTISHVRLEEKSGGKSGSFKRGDE